MATRYVLVYNESYGFLVSNQHGYTDYKEDLSAEIKWSDPSGVIGYQPSRSELSRIYREIADAIDADALLVFTRDTVYIEKPIDELTDREPVSGPHTT